MIIYKTAVVLNRIAAVLLIMHNAFYKKQSFAITYD